jgi:hypothetical protein
VSAAELLDRAAAAGVEIFLAGDRVKLRAQTAPPADLLAEMRSHKAELVELLASGSGRRVYRFRLHDGEGGGVYISDETALDRARDALASRYGDRLAMVTPA